MIRSAEIDRRPGIASKRKQTAGHLHMTQKIPAAEIAAPDDDAHGYV